MKQAGRSILQGNAPTVLLAVPLFLLLFLLKPPTDHRAALQAAESDCINQEFNGYEVVASRLLDTDGDGGLEEVALVANDDSLLKNNQLESYDGRFFEII